MIVQILFYISCVMCMLTFFVIGIMIIVNEDLPRLVAILFGASVIALDLFFFTVMITGG